MNLTPPPVFRSESENNSQQTPISPSLFDGATPGGTFRYVDTPEKTPISSTLSRGYYYSEEFHEKIEVNELKELKFWLNAGRPLPKETCACAAGHGHLKVLTLAREIGCPWDVDTCTSAAMNGHLEVLKFARKKGCPWDERTCTAAAWHGRLKVLKWARANGCPWDKETCYWPAAEGHLEVLKWARENGAPER